MPKRVARASVAATVLAILFAALFFAYGRTALDFDSAEYAEHARAIASQGLSAYRNASRAYGYPLFLAGPAALAERGLAPFRLAAFLLQLAVFLGACAAGAALLARRLPPGPGRAALYPLLVLNPVLLLNTGQLISDLPSASLLFLGVALTVSELSGDPVPMPHGRPSRRWAQAALTAALLGASVAMRPANFAVLLVCGLFWAAAALARRVSWTALPVAALVIGILALPQIDANVAGGGAANPALPRLYLSQLDGGILYLKRATIVEPPVARGAAFYVNPLADSARPRFDEFAPRHPTAYAATLGLHLFALIDQDYPLTYVSDPTPWYRWPLAVLNFGFWILAAAGAWRIARRRATPRGLFAPLGAAAGLYAAVYAPAVIECRFALPLFLLATPMAAIGLDAVGDLARSRPRRIAAMAAGAIVLIALACLLSAWIERQAPYMDMVRRLRERPENERAGVLLPGGFADLPPFHPAARYARLAVRRGLLEECGPDRFCPYAPVPRGDLPRALLRALHGAAYTPSDRGCDAFHDVPPSDGRAPWICDLESRGLALSCGLRRFCPDQPISRADAAHALLLARYGRDYRPAPSGRLFDDVAPESPAAPWIAQLVRDGVAGGCSSRDFCPDQPVNRAQLSILLTRLFLEPRSSAFPRGADAPGSLSSKTSTDGSSYTDRKPSGRLAFQSP